MSLRKNPETRPSHERIIGILEEAISENSTEGGFGALANASAAIEREEAELENAALIEAQNKARRQSLAETADEALRGIVDELEETIVRFAPAAKRVEHRADEIRVIQLGRAWLKLKQVRRCDSDRAQQFLAISGWDLIAVSEIGVEQIDPTYQWSASLWFMNDPDSGEYRWHESCYFRPRGGELFSPYALSHPSAWQDAAHAMGPGMHTIQLAWGPEPIDDEAVLPFISRWSYILAQGAQGLLRSASRLPLEGRFWEK